MSILVQINDNNLFCSYLYHHHPFNTFVKQSLCLAIGAQQGIYYIGAIKMKPSIQKKPTTNSVLGSPQIQQQPIITDISPPPCKQADRKAISSFQIRKVNPQGNEREQTLKKLVEMNQNYLRDKIKISDVPKPSKYAHKMPSKTGSSQYNRNYASLNRSLPHQDSTPKRDTTGSILKLHANPIAGYASTYNADFTAKQHDASPSKNLKKYTKSDAPAFIQTSYHRDYQSVTASPSISAKRQEVKLMGGGKLSTETTYKQCYRLKTIDSSDLSKPIVHKDNKIFVKLDSQPTSIYQQTFKKGKAQNIQASFKPNQKYTPSLQASRMKYKTQYGQVFVEQNLAERRDFECLTKDELKKYVMGILDN